MMTPVDVPAIGMDDWGMTKTPTPKPTVRRVIAEHSADLGWLTMTPEGDVDRHRTPAAIVRWVKARDAREGTGFDVTVLEWRNVPENFTPPR